MASGQAPQGGNHTSQSSNDDTPKGLVPWLSKLITAIVTALAILAATAGATSLWHHFSSKPPPSPKGPPIRVATINLGQCVHLCAETGDFVFPQKVIFSPADVRHIAQMLGSLDSMNTYGEWMRDHGGVDVGNVDIQLTLVGNWPQGADILNIEPVGNCTTRLSGTYSMYVGAGSEPTIPLGFNLDEPGAQAQAIEEYGGGSDVRLGEPYFLNHTVSLNYNEQQVFQIAAFTQKQYCQFRLKMTILLGHQRQVYETIGNGKYPFQVTGGFSPLPDHYPIVYGGGIGASPCLAQGRIDGQFGMIKPHLSCVAQ